MTITEWGISQNNLPVLC